SRCLLTRPGTGCQEIFLRPPARRSPRCSGKSLMFSQQRDGRIKQNLRRRANFLRLPFWSLWLAMVILLGCASCSGRHDRNTLVMVIEFSPTNLDPRVGTDAQSERIDELIFDPLVHRDEHFNIQPWAAERWEIPDPRTYIFHLRHGIRFHDGRPLTARDVKWTLDSLRNGSLITLKA